jgi:hypothetical protein
MLFYLIMDVLLAELVQRICHLAARTGCTAKVAAGHGRPANGEGAQVPLRRKFAKGRSGDRGHPEITDLEALMGPGWRGVIRCFWDQLDPFDGQRITKAVKAERGGFEPPRQVDPT